MLTTDTILAIEGVEAMATLPIPSASIRLGVQIERLRALARYTREPGRRADLDGILSALADVRDDVDQLAYQTRESSAELAVCRSLQDQMRGRIGELLDERARDRETIAALRHEVKTATWTRPQYGAEAQE